MRLDVVREIGQREETFSRTSRCYLLNGDFEVLNASCTGRDATGGSFFDLFPAKRALCEEVAAYVRSYPREMLLTLLGRTPVLFIGTFFAHTGLLFAILPEGDIAKTLSFPAAFHHVPAAIGVSASAQMRYKAHREEDFADACRWLLSVSTPFLACEADKDLAAALALCATRLSRLVDVPLSFDFSGLGARACADTCTALAVGVMLSALLAARRVGCTDGVCLYAAMEGTPTLYLEYTCPQATVAPVEFSPLLSCAAARGMMLDVVTPKSDPARVQIRACFGTVELSAQGVRERHRFLEGKSPLCALTQTRAAPIPFPELSFD